MKIEKINDNQIRCTVTMADLHDRHIKISELITNSAKAKSFLQDMVQQASAEFGFEADGMSLMIETSPAAEGTVIFTITKMNGDTPMPFPETNQETANPPVSKLFGADTMEPFVNKVRSSVDNEQQLSDNEKSPVFCIFSFDSLEQVIQTARIFDGHFNIKTSLYKDDLASCYLLLVFQYEMDEPDFNRACNMLSEYAVLEDSDQAVLAYVKEHNQLIVENTALATLASL